MKRRWQRFPRTKQGKSAAEVVSSVIDHYRLGPSPADRAVHTAWNEVVGERIAARTWPGRVRDGVLKVRVSNAAWLQELSFMCDEAKLVDEMRKRTGGLVDDIVFYVGKPRPAEVDRLAAAERTRRAPAPPRREIAPAIGDDLARIDAETESVNDDELRDIIREARRKLNL